MLPLSPSALMTTPEGTVRSHHASAWSAPPESGRLSPPWTSIVRSVSDLCDSNSTLPPSLSAPRPCASNEPVWTVSSTDMKKTSPPWPSGSLPVISMLAESVRAAAEKTLSSPPFPPPSVSVPASPCMNTLPPSVIEPVVVRIVMMPPSPPAPTERMSIVPVSVSVPSAVRSAEPPLPPKPRIMPETVRLPVFASADIGPPMPRLPPLVRTSPEMSTLAPAMSIEPPEPSVFVPRASRMPSICTVPPVDVRSMRFASTGSETSMRAGAPCDGFRTAIGPSVCTTMLPPWPRSAVPGCNVRLLAVIVMKPVSTSSVVPCRSTTSFVPKSSVAPDVTVHCLESMKHVFPCIDEQTPFAFARGPQAALAGSAGNPAASARIRRTSLIGALR